MSAQGNICGGSVAVPENEHAEHEERIKEGLVSLGTEHSSFKIKGVKKQVVTGHLYTYEIVIVDKDGNESSETVRMTCWERVWLKEGEQRQYKILQNDE
jgi:hypothetical protein